MHDQSSEKQLRIRSSHLYRCHINEVIRIEISSFEFPWPKEDFIRVLKMDHTGIVIKHKKKVIGFMVYKLYKKAVNIFNLAVDPCFRRKGVGTQMVKRLINKSLNENRTHILMEIRETNLGAQLFLRKQGFIATEILHDSYKFCGINEDAYLMQYNHDAQSHA